MTQWFCKRFLNFVNAFLYFVVALFLVEIHVKQHKNPLYPMMFCAKFGLNWSSEKIFNFCQYIFAISIFSPHWKRAWSFIWTNKIKFSLHPLMLCPKFDSEEEDKNVKSSRQWWHLRRWTTHQFLLSLLFLEKKFWIRDWRWKTNIIYN